MGRKAALVLLALLLELVPGCGSSTLRGVQSTVIVGDAVWYIMIDDHSRAIILRCVDNGERPVCQTAER